MNRIISTVLLVLAVVLSASQFAYGAAVGRTVGLASVSDSGAAEYTIPLWTPPGTNGMQPSLALKYSSRGGRSPFGTGWSLSGLSTIYRCGTTWEDGTPRDVRNDALDRFCIDGKKLRLVSGTYGAAGAEYRSEIEDFARVRSFGTAGAGPMYFTVEMKDGRIYEYGNTAESRIFPVGQSTVRLWALNKIRDRSGNAMMFKYLIDSANGSYVIDNVIYTQNVSQGTSPHYTVQFSYQSVPATEVNWTYQANKLVKRVLRSHQIDINFDGLMMRRYLLSYEPSLSAPNPSRLLGVRECTGPFEADCFNQTGFTYQNPSSGLLPEIDTGIGSQTYGLYPYERARFMDVNGDGIEDMVFPSVMGSSTPSYWYVAFANGSGSYSTPFSTGIATSEHERAVVIDYNADGLEDLLVPYSGNTWWVILGTTSGLAAPFDTGISAVNASLARVLDIDGDGLQDLMWVDQTLYPDRLYYRRRELSGTFSAATTITTGLEAILYLSEPAKRSMVRVPDFNGDGRGDYEVGGYVLEDADDQRYSVTDNFVCTGMAYSECGFVTGYLGGLVPNVQPQFGDFNGDGLTDVIFTRLNTTRVMFSTGTRATTELSLGADYGNRTTVFDWDGDGRDDILYLNGNTSTLYVRRSTGESFAAGFNTGVALAGDSFLAVSDVNGDGLPDLVYSSNGSIRVRLHAGVKADLMTHAADAFGVGAIFTYESISRNNHTREAATFPLQSYSAPLLVVSRITHTTGAATPPTYTQDYWYYGGKLHLQGRGFAGFSKRRMLDSRTSLRRYEEYEQSFPLTGQRRRQSVYQANDTTLVSRSDFTWQVATYGGGVNTRQLPWVSRTDSFEYELGGTFNGQLVRTQRVDNLLDTTTGTIYDTTSTVTEGASANGIQPGATYTTRQYQPVAQLLNDVTNWCIGRPQAVQVIVSHSQFSGGAKTQTTDMAWDPAACRLTQETIEPGHAQLQVIRTPGYDRFGNVASVSVTGVGMATRTTIIDWGAEGRFPEEITNALSQTDHFGWDLERGLVQSHTDPNGEQTTWSVDRFNRRIGETRPDGTSTAWEYIDCTNHLYCINDQVGSFVIEEKSKDRLGVVVADTTDFLDQYDRPVRRLSKSLTGAYTRLDINYDALGRVSRRSAPCWVSSCVQYWTTYSYDLLDRLTGTQRPTSATDPTLQSTFVYYEGLTTRSVDRLSKQSTHVLNALGQLARSTDHNGYYQNFDYDGLGGLVRVADSASNTLISNTYNIRGMRTAQTDMDMGAWIFTPNALGEIVSQLDAKNQTTSFVYDLLGRMTSRTEAEGVSTFTFGTSASAHEIGRLTAVSGPGYTEGYTYDTAGRTSRKTVMSDATYYIDYSYNAIGALDTLTYPTSTSGYRLKLQYDYENGLLKRVKDFNAPSTVFWTANDSDARGNVTDETLGNGIQTVRGFDAVTGRLEYIQSGVGGGSAQQNSNYVWDPAGNLRQRTESNLGLTQDYQYDNLHRLTRWTVNGVSPIDLAYDGLGNITSRSGVGTYTYHATRKHLLTQAGTRAFAYDNNGNATTRNGSAITWYSYNLPRLISASGNNSSEFFYAPDRSRWKQVASYGGTSEQTVYIGGLIEKTTIGGVTSWKHYISGANGFVAEHIRRSSGTNDTVYLLKDHLGSVEMITNATGGVSARLAYGGQGPRRNGTTWGGTPSSADLTTISNTTRRGFTGHEMLDNLELVHMNGRVYDTYVGRFLSADPFVQDPTNTQSFNRYSYVLNNPIRYADPTGYLFDDDDDDYPYIPPFDPNHDDDDPPRCPVFGGCTPRPPCRVECGQVPVPLPGIRPDPPRPPAPPPQIPTPRPAPTPQATQWSPDAIVSGASSGISLTRSLSAAPRTPVETGTQELFLACNNRVAGSCEALREQNRKDLQVALSFIRERYPQVLEPFGENLPAIGFDDSIEFRKARAGATDFYSGNITLTSGYNSIADVAATLVHELVHSSDGIGGRALTNFQDWLVDLGLAEGSEKWNLGPRHSELHDFEEEVEEAYRREGGG